MEQTIDVKKTLAKLDELKALCGPLKEGFEKAEGRFEEAKRVITTRLAQLEKEEAEFEKSFVDDVLSEKEPTYLHLDEMPAERERLEKRLGYLKSKCAPVLEELRACVYMPGQIQQLANLLSEYEGILARIKALEDALKTLPGDELIQKRLDRERQAHFQKVQRINVELYSMESALKNAREQGLLEIKK